MMKTRLFVIAFLLSSLIGFEVPKPVTIPDGAYGVFQCYLDMPLYTDGQNAVDREDSALIRKWHDGLLIADHAGSVHGEDRWYVTDLALGEAVFLITPTVTRAYSVTAVYMGEYSKTDYLYHGEPVRPDTNDIICISCGRKDTVFIAYLDYKGELP